MWSTSWERLHQGKDNALLSEPTRKQSASLPTNYSADDEIVLLHDIRYQQRMGGLLKHYSRKAT